MTKIKEARMALGITAAEAARRIGISRQRYSQYERGIYEANYEMLLRIGEAFGVSVDFLVDRKSTPAEIRRSAIVGRVMSLTDEQIELLADALDKLATVQAAPAETSDAAPADAEPKAVKTSDREYFQDLEKRVQAAAREKRKGQPRGKYHIRLRSDGLIVSQDSWGAQLEPAAVAPESQTAPKHK